MDGVRGKTEAQIQQAVDAARKTRREFFADDSAVRIGLIRMLGRYNVEVRYKSWAKSPKKEGDKYILTLYASTPEGRENYILAHELGHIVLGHNIEAMRERFSDGQLSVEERQANIFANNLLMPERKFRDVCRECGNRVEKVAYSFCVTPSAAGVRMAMLGIEEGKR